MERDSIPRSQFNTVLTANVPNGLFAIVQAYGLWQPIQPIHQGRATTSRLNLSARGRQIKQFLVVNKERAPLWDRNFNGAGFGDASVDAERHRIHGAEQRRKQMAYAGGC